MTQELSFDFIKSVFKKAYEHDVETEIWWDGETFPVINCNDFFSWACADAEEITPGNLDIFSQSLQDCRDDTTAGLLLFCARSREMRPQGAYYSFIDEKYWSLFDACGPEREKGMGNPYNRGEYQKTKP